MSPAPDFRIERCDFNTNLFAAFNHLHHVKNLWPVVYILSDGNIKEAYVGETTDAFSRMSNHLRSNAKNRLTTVHVITSDKFNKSATLDIEASLIKYISGDGQYKLLNGNIGLANHNYYQKKEFYWEFFKTIWDKLRSEGLVKHSISHITNSDLFKYSPYKSLGHEQKRGLSAIIRGLLNEDVKNILIEGGAGTGKTILAVFLFKLLHSNNEDFNFKEFGDDEQEFIQLIAQLKEKYPAPKMALVVPMSSFRSTLQKVFRNIKGLNAGMVIGPSDLAKGKFDIVVVDESHRLRRRVNLGTYYKAFDAACKKLNLDKNSCSELDWVTIQSEKAILFYDEGQSIKPSDAKREDFEKVKAGTCTRIEHLKSQFRVKGGNDYVQYIDDLLRCTLLPSNERFNPKEYEFLLFDSIEEMEHEIKLRDKEAGLARLMAGYSWAWVSKKEKDKFDILIGKKQLKWNSTAKDWVNSVNSVNEVGCIHTTQGYDLNYAGIIFGNEITYDASKNEIVIIKENYHDKNGKQSITDPAQLKEFIINIYKTMMLRGIKGTYLYVCDENLRNYFAKYINGHKKGKANTGVQNPETIPVERRIPLYNIRAAAGDFSDQQKAAELKKIELPPEYKPLSDFFACKVEGESMNRIIPNGSICLFRKYTGGSRNGKIVLVQHTNIQDPEFGSGYTVKEYHSVKITIDGHWGHQSITLKPLSYDKTYMPLEILKDELSSLEVIGIFERIL